MRRYTLVLHVNADPGFAGGYGAAAAAARRAAADVALHYLFRGLGRAVQVDPIKPKLSPPGTGRLILTHDELHSSLAFKFNLRR